MKKMMRVIALISVVLTIVCSCLYAAFNRDVLLSMAITFGTISYHFVMRLIVGFVVDRIMNNRADYRKKWFQCSDREMKVYDRLKIKSWKGKMPAYEPDLFNPGKHSWEEIVQATCQAEIVHEIIVILSAIPVLFSMWFGAFWVFLITTILAAIFDMCFVMIQRYNRPRIIRLIKR